MIEFALKKYILIINKCLNNRSINKRWSFDNKKEKHLFVPLFSNANICWFSLSSLNSLLDKMTFEV